MYFWELCFSYTNRNFVNTGQEKRHKGFIRRSVRYCLSHKENSISTSWGVMGWKINKWIWAEKQTYCILFFFFFEHYNSYLSPGKMIPEARAEKHLISNRSHQFLKNELLHCTVITDFLAYLLNQIISSLKARTIFCSLSLLLTPTTMPET